MSYTYAGRFGSEAVLKRLSSGAMSALRVTPVRVTKSGDGTLATLYSDRAKTTTVSNPILTDNDGNLSFFADPGDYILTAIVDGVDQAPAHVTVPIDPVEAAQDQDVAAMIPLAQRGVANGVATLDGTGVVPDAQIPATITRDAELSSAVAAAVNQLVAGAPGALDTLKELADAVNDDASFAASVTAALAGKAAVDLSNVTPSTGRAALGLGALATKSAVAAGDLSFDPATQAELDAETALRLAGDTARGIVAVTTAYTLGLSDAGKVVEGLTNAASFAVTVPPNSSVAFPVGTFIDVMQTGGVAVTVAAGAGVTLQGSTLTTSGQWTFLRLSKRATDTWVVETFATQAALTAEQTARANADAAETTNRVLGDTTRTANAQTTDYTLVAADAGKVVEVNAATGKTVTIPLASSVPYTVGTIIEVQQIGAGAVTVVGAGGVTIAGATLATAGVGQSLLLRNRGTDSWVVKAAGSGTNVPGIYLPSGWGSHWAAAKAAAGSTPARLAVVGDSIAQGGLASVAPTKGWVGLLRAALQAAYGDGGTGFVGNAWTQFFMNGSLPTSWFGSRLVTKTGTWNGPTAPVGGTGDQFFGPGGVAFASAGAGTLTYTVKGTVITIYTIAYSGGPTATVTIDGGAVASIDTNNGSTIIKASTYNVSAGTHTVVITAAGANLNVCGVAGENASGIVVDDYSASSARALDFDGTGDTVTNGTVPAWSGGYQRPADLVIYALGVNDAAGGRTAVQWNDSVRKYIAAVKDSGGQSGRLGNVDLVIVIPHGGTASNLGVYQEIAGRARMLAEVYGAALVDFWTLGRTSWDYIKSLGYWGDTDADPGTAGSNSLHMEDTGNQWMYNQLVAAVPALIA